MKNKKFDRANWDEIFTIFDSFVIGLFPTIVSFLLFFFFEYQKPPVSDHRHGFPESIIQSLDKIS